MEKKKCPYCGGEIMMAARKCKHCGEWIEEKPQSAPVSPVHDTEVKIEHSNSKKVVLIVLAAIILAIVTWIIVISNQKSDWERTMEQYNSQSHYNDVDDYWYD